MAPASIARWIKSRSQYAVRMITGAISSSAISAAAWMPSLPVAGARRTPGRTCDPGRQERPGQFDGPLADAASWPVSSLAGILANQLTPGQQPAGRLSAQGDGRDDRSAAAMQLARGRRPSGSGDHIGVRRCRRRPGYGPPWTVRWPLRRCGSPAGILQVTDTVGKLVGVSGIDGPTGFDLRCQTREALVSYLQREHPEALPRSNRCFSLATPPMRRCPEPLGSMLSMISEAVFS